MRGVLYVVWLSACGFEHGRLEGMGMDLVDAPEQTADTAVDTVVPIECPPSYTIKVASSSSKFRVIDAMAPFTSQHQVCNADQPGRTHLESPETADEATDLRAMLVDAGKPGGNYYIGVVQKPSQAQPADSWFVFTGEALPGAVWVVQPGDDIVGENNEENLGAINTVDMMHDVTGDFAYPAICECDGLPIDPTVAGYIP